MVQSVGGEVRVRKWETEEMGWGITKGNGMGECQSGPAVLLRQERCRSRKEVEEEGPRQAASRSRKRKKYLKKKTNQNLSRY